MSQSVGFWIKVCALGFSVVVWVDVNVDDIVAVKSRSGSTVAVNKKLLYTL